MSERNLYNRGTGRDEVARQVPWRVRAVAFFGGQFQAFGWFWLAPVSAVLWVFLPLVDFSSLAFWGEEVEVPAIVISCGETRAGEGGSKVYEVVSGFEDSSGRILQDTSYVVGEHYTSGESVRVVYLASDSSRSRLVGGRKGHFSPWSWSFLVTLIFPAVGLGLILPGFVRGLRCMPLLKGGTRAEALWVGTDETRTTVNNKPVFRFRFRFEAGGREYDASARSVDVDLFGRGLRQPVLYDPLNPSHNIVVNNLPGRVRLGVNDVFVSPSPLRAAVTMLLPLVFVAVNGVCAYFVLVARALD